MPRVHRVAALLDRWWLWHPGNMVAIDAGASRLLSSGRVHFPIQSPPLIAVIVACFSGRLLQQAVQHEPEPLQGHLVRRSSQPRKPNVGDTETEVYTQFSELRPLYLRKPKCQVRS